ncbi:unnamed protein product [Adineta steineri]|uniref:Uncharacterized protein n=1 Tax=Adineta steineri TaxID=433720 RepID=A0A815H033_9BILA|nr:unnamed protein product [Adineta steineri]CAF1285793.1 unnamed protein product [Adineta steineri]CAF1347534.1 unnamed protein product [Adineta steineri]CAF1556390.1 unnamed protein product [Adineta steineri]CAF3739700.1 unnamed protein product [Adineta steineri]
MMRIILFGTFFVLLTNKRQLDAVRELYGQSSDRIRAANLNIDQLKNPSKEYARQQYKYTRARERSPTYGQSRRFHFDQAARDARDLGQPASFTSQITSSYYYSYGGPGTSLGASSQEACRLTNNFCARDYQCCSGKCRCVRWSIMGKVSCYKKCF